MMRDRTKAWFRAAAVLTAVGLILFAAVMTAARWDFTKLNTVEFVTETYSVGEDFNAIQIEVDTADVVFAPSDDGKCSVTAYEQEDTSIELRVAEGTLCLSLHDGGNWFDRIGVAFTSPRIFVCLPKSAYDSLTVNGSTGSVEIPADFSFTDIDVCVTTGDVNVRASADALKLQTTTGDIAVADASVKTMALTVTTGDVTVSDVNCEGEAVILLSTGETKLTDFSCGSLSTKGSTGNVVLTRVTAEGEITVETSTGDVRLTDSDAAELTAYTATGDVTGSLRSGSIRIEP